MFDIFVLTVFAILPLDTLRTGVHCRYFDVQSHAVRMENGVYWILMKTDDRRFCSEKKRERKEYEGSERHKWRVCVVGGFGILSKAKRS